MKGVKLKQKKNKKTPATYNCPDK